MLSTVSSFSLSQKQVAPVQATQALVPPTQCSMDVLQIVLVGSSIVLQDFSVLVFQISCCGCSVSSFEPIPYANGASLSNSYPFQIIMGKKQVPAVKCPNWEVTVDMVAQKGSREASHVQRNVLFAAKLPHFQEY